MGIQVVVDIQHKTLTSMVRSRLNSSLNARWRLRMTAGNVESHVENGRIWERLKGYTAQRVAEDSTIVLEIAMV